MRIHETFAVAVAACIGFAGMAGAAQVPLWEITDEGERAVPQVDLSMGPPPK